MVFAVVVRDDQADFYAWVNPGDAENSLDRTEKLTKRNRVNMDIGSQKTLIKTPVTMFSKIIKSKINFLQIRIS